MNAVEWLEAYQNRDRTEIGEDLAVGVICGLLAEVKQLKAKIQWNRTRDWGNEAAIYYKERCDSLEIKQRDLLAEVGRLKTAGHCFPVQYLDEEIAKARIMAAMEVIYIVAQYPAFTFFGDPGAGVKLHLLQAIKVHFGLNDRRKPSGPTRSPEGIGDK